MADALHLKFRGFVRTYPRRYESPPDGFVATVKVVRGQKVILGRGEDADVVYQTPDVSRRHCVIDATGPTFVLADLESKSGTRINGRPLEEPTVVSAGDEIGIGQVLILVHEEPPPREDRSLEAWARELATGSRDRRWAAAEALCSAGTEGRGAIASLIRALDDEHAPVRRYAARALGLIGHDLAVPVLAGRLDEEDGLVAVEIVRALGRFEERAGAAATALSELLFHPGLRRPASRTLARIGPPAVDALTTTLGSDDVEAVRLAAQALAEIGEGAADAVDELADLAAHEDEEVRRDALRALSKLGHAAAPAVKTLFEVMDRDHDDRVRAWATSALGAAARETRFEAKAVAELTRALEDPPLRFSAIVALGRLGSAASVATTSLRRIASGTRELYAKAAEEALTEIEAVESTPL